MRKLITILLLLVGICVAADQQKTRVYLEPMNGFENYLAAGDEAPSLAPTRCFARVRHAQEQKTVQLNHKLLPVPGPLLVLQRTGTHGAFFGLFILWLHGAFPNTLSDVWRTLLQRSAGHGGYSFCPQRMRTPVRHCGRSPREYWLDHRCEFVQT